MTNPLRLCELAAGILILFLAGVKVVGPAETLTSPSVLLVTVLELSIGLGLVIGRWPVLSSGALTLLGALLTAWTILAGPEALAQGRCGCFGGYHVEYFSHVLIAAAILGVGGVLFGAQRTGRRV